MTWNIDFRDADSIDRGIADIQAQYVTIASKTERGEALGTGDVLSMAHWVGLVQGVLSERATALRAARPLSQRAHVMDFYTRQANAAEAVGFPHLADALRQRSSEGDTRRAAPSEPSEPSTHPERQSCMQCPGIHAADEPHRTGPSPYSRRS